LLLNRKLGVIGIVGENGVVLESGDEFVESEGTDSEILPEVISTAVFEHVEDMVHVCWTTGKGVPRLFIAALIHVRKLGPNPSTKEGWLSSI
jgi:hypothetical protein